MSGHRETEELIKTRNPMWTDAAASEIVRFARCRSRTPSPPHRKERLRDDPRGHVAAIVVPNG
jgi:hypothetical protein